MIKRLIITEEEKKQILSLYKPVISEGIKGTSYFTENDQKIYFGTNTSYVGGDYVDIKKGTEFKQADGGATAWGGSLTFSCKSVGTVKFKNGTGNKNYSYKGKTYWANALTKKLNSIFCQENSNLSKGCIKGDCKNGQGTQTGMNSDGVKWTYTGSFKNGLYNDKKGKMTWSDGYSYVGNFKDSERTGYGEFTYPDRSFYKGYFKNSERTGYGEYTDINGSTYKGYYKDNFPSGWGEYTYSDRSFYKGYYKDGEKSGWGTYKNVKGIEFSGNWVEDSLNGKSESDLDKLDKPITAPSSNPQTPVGSNSQTPVGSNSQTPVGSKPSDAPDTKTFQQWVIKQGDKTILGKGGDSGFGDDGKWGARTKAAWDKYKDQYNLEIQSKFPGIDPNDDGSNETFDPPVVTIDPTLI